MRFLIFGLLITVLIPVSLDSTDFQEIIDYGWGTGMLNSKPAVYDLDQDGLLDLLVGERAGNINHFRQREYAGYELELVTSDLLPGYQIPFAAPCINDLDGNGLLDLLIGEINGNIHHFEQHPDDPFCFLQITDHFCEIDVGLYSVPFLADPDQDGFLDLLIGRAPWADPYHNNISHYKQSSDESEFYLITDFFLSSNIHGNSAPTITDLEQNGLFDLIVGEGDGELKSFEQSDPGSLDFLFTDIDFYSISGDDAAPCFTDLDSDGNLDLLVGEVYGNINLFEYDGSSYHPFGRITNYYGWIDVELYSHPTCIDIDNDGLLDLICGNQGRRIFRFEQNSPSDICFTLDQNFYLYNVSGTNQSAPTFTDFDNDGLLDLCIGADNGKISYFRQNEIGLTEFELITPEFAGIDVGTNSVPIFTNLNGNAQLDLLIGNNLGTIHYYEQQNEDEFLLIDDNFANIDVGFKSAPTVADIDNDNCLDLLIGNHEGRIYHYRQNEPHSLDFTLQTSNFENIHLQEASHPLLTDINNDDLPDLLVGNFDGGIHYFQNETITACLPHQLERFSAMNLINFPNPVMLDSVSGSMTVFSFSLNHQMLTILSVYNIKGEKITTLINTILSPGTHNFNWNGFTDSGKKISTGIYLYSLQAGMTRESGKLIILKR